MKVVVPHHSTQQALIPILDKGADQLLGGAGGRNIQILNQKKTWDGPVMTFSCTGKAGFISVPLSGTVAVDDTNVTVECELPAMVKKFVGEEKIQGMVEQRIRAMVQPVA
jgi:hypothetical protein